MRLFVALTVALFLAPATAIGGSQPEPRDALAVTTVRVIGDGVHLSWSPAPGAVLYEIHRGPSVDELVLVGKTAGLEFTDVTAPDADLLYEVVSVHTSTSLGEHVGPMRGRCVAMRSAGIAITVANCMPAESPITPLVPRL